MTRTMWDWLGIEATKDKRLIKKAYAEQSKKYHPEDAPEEATQLRNAYKMALAYAESDIEKQSFPHNIQENLPEDGSKAISGIVDDEHQYVLNDQQEKTDSPKVSSENIDDAYQYTFHEQTKTDTERPQTSEKNYRYDALGDEQIEISLNDGISYKIPAHWFNTGREDRIRKLYTCFQNIYENKSYRDNFNKWRDAVSDCLTKEDLEDVFVIVVVIAILGQMPDISPLAWYGLEQALFRYSANNAEWRRLKNEFAKVRAANNSYEDSEETYQRSVYSENQNATGDTKSSVTFILKIIAAVVIIIRILSRFM